MRKRSVRFRWLAGALVLGTTAAAQGDILPDPRLTILPEAVAVEGLRPGDSAVVVGFGREHFAGVATRRFYRWESLTDSDHDGRVELVAETGKYPILAVWMAYLPASGGLLVANTEAPLVPTQGEPLATDPENGVLELDSAQKLQLLFRRDGSTWIWNGRGEAEMGRGPSGEPKFRISASPDSFVPLSDSDTTFQVVEPGDLLVSVHQLDLVVETRSAR